MSHCVKVDPFFVLLLLLVVDNSGRKMEVRRVLLVVLVGVLGIVGGMEFEKVRRERASIQYGYSPIEGEALFLDFDEDLYMSDDLYCLPLSEDLPQATCLPCVYSDPANCPSNVDPNSPEFSEEEQEYLSTLPPCECARPACFFPEIKQGETLDIEVTESSSVVYRYEHKYFDRGFTSRKKAISNLSPSIAMSVSPFFGLTQIVATSDADNMMVCPSHPLFGPKGNVVTYFISIQSGRPTSIKLSIEDLPFSDFEDPPEFFSTANSSTYYDIVEQDLDKGALTFVDGFYYFRTYGTPFSPIANYLLLYPISECGTYSLHTETLGYGIPELWIPQIYLGSVTQTYLDNLPDLGGGAGVSTSVAEFFQLGSTVHWVSQDSVMGFCPESEDEQNYIVVWIYASPYPWTAKFFLQNAASSQFIKSYSLGDPFWSYLQVQERLKEIWTLNLPCGENEFCLETPLPFSFVTRKNLILNEYFPSLLYPTDNVPREDMLPSIGFQTNSSYFLRCQDRIRDSGCGLMVVFKGGSYASPLVYPAAEPLYSINPLPTLQAGDITDIFPFKDNSITLFVTASVQYQTIISKERWDGTRVLFSNPNRLHTKDFRNKKLQPITIGDVQQKETTPCNFDTFNPIYELFTYFHDVLQDSQNGNSRDPSAKNFLNIDAQTANYWSYSLSWTSEFQSCWANTLALHSFRTEETLLTNSTICTNPNDLSDPCCNPNLGWSDCCSPEDRSVLQIQSLPSEIDQDFSDDNCFDPDCMETLAGDFREIYESSLLDEICLVNDDISPNITQFFQSCTSRYIGDEPDFGVYCASNSDCDFLGDEDGYCDLKEKKCVVATEYQENAFLQCLIDQMGGFTATLVYQQLVNDGIANPSDNDGGEFLTADLLRQYAVDGETRCFDDYGPVSDMHEYFTLEAQPTQRQSICPVCDDTQGLSIRCLTEFSCVTPIQCLDTGPSCVNNFVRKTPGCEEPTDSDYVCNWDNSITDRAVCEEEEFRCVHCFNSTYCVDLPATSRDECENTPVCVLFDSTVLWDVSEEECENRKTCSDGGVTTEEDCLNGGSCDDPDAIYDSIVALLPVFPQLAGALNGVCVTPLSPFNSPACPLLRPTAIVSLDFSTQRGCVRLGQCFFNFAVGEFTCLQDPTNELDCITQFGGTWLPLPISNQADCENPRSVDQEDTPGFCRQNYKDIYLSPQNRSDCEDCGGEPLRPATWDALKWERGTSVRATWREAKMEPLWTASTSTISYFKLQDLFEQVALNYQTFILWTGEACLINPFIEYINIVACDCPSGGNPSDDMDNPLIGFNLENDECSTETETGIIGTIWFCPNSDFKIGVISGVITSRNEYISGDLCFFSEITLAATSSFVGNRPSEPVTVTNDPNELDPEPVRNQKGASVGFVLGDGVAFQLSDNVQPVDWDEDVTGVELTFTVDRSVFEDNDIPDWYIVDFGIEVVDKDEKTQPSDEIELRPVDASIGSTVGITVKELLDISRRGSTDIDGILPDPFRYKKAARIYPIARLPDWEDENVDEALSDGEQAMTGVFAALYGIAFFVTILILIKGMHSLTLSLLVLFVYVLATFSFRTAFWAIVASGDYEETSAGYYILIEPPSFFILSVLTVLIMSFAFIVAASKSGGDKLAQYWVAWLVLQLFLIAVLFVVVGLMIGLDNNDVITISCFGRESTVEENTTIRDIRIAYHSFILAVAIICAVYVVKLGRDLPDDENKQTLQVLSALAGLAVVLTSLLWVIYSAIDETTPYFVIPLFFTEVPPLLLMCYLAFPSTVQYEAQEMDL